MVRKQPSPFENERSFQLESRSSFISDKPEPIKPLRPIQVFTQQTKAEPEAIEEEEEDEEDDEKKERIRELKKNLRKMLLFIITNFGMLLLVFGYIFMGAYLFQTLEQHTEVQNCETGRGAEQDMIKEYTQTFFNYIYFNTSVEPLVDSAEGNQTFDGPDVYNQVIDDYILEIRDFVLTNYGSYKFYGQSDCQAMSMWQSKFDYFSNH